MRKRLFLPALLLGAITLAISAPAAASTITGTWSGVLDLPSQPLVFVIDVQQHGNNLSAIASSPYQGGGPIPVDDFTQRGAAIAFTIARLGVSFHGTLAENRITGTFGQNGMNLPLTLLANARPASDLEGAWIGTLHVGSTSLPLGVRVSRTEQGAYTAAFDSPAQHAFGIATSDLQTASGAFAFSLPSVGASYQGKVTGEDIAGTFTQNGASFPLTFARPTIATVAAAPVVKPLPTASPQFTSTNVHFASTGAVLAGTLTVPDGARGKLPAFVFLHGSGPGTRNGALEANPTFLFLSNALSNGGAVVLRYDKRGIGESTGARTEDWRALGADARAAVAFLQAQPHVDPKHIYLVGHSEGGLIAPLVAARDHAVAGIVLMAPPAVPMARILREQSSRASAQLYRAEKRAFASYDGIDPANVIKHVDVPVLVLQGTADMQILPADLHHLTDAARAAHKRLTVDLLSGDDHLFVHVPPNTAPFAEYSMPEPLDPRVPKAILAWMRANQGC